VLTIPNLLRAVGLVAIAGVLGFLAGWGLLYLMIAVLPPFRPEDDDTLREIVPVGLTYLTWALTSSVVFVVGLRRLQRKA
jgi:ABC-type antimicrobial peptide transport system permease subunit